MELRMRLWVPRCLKERFKDVLGHVAEAFETRNCLSVDVVQTRNVNRKGDARITHCWGVENLRFTTLDNLDCVASAFSSLWAIPYLNDPADVLAKQFV
jgi:hypothetical protein